MELDQTHWEPTPSQYAITGLTVAWITALVVEQFLLGQQDVYECLKHVVTWTLSGRFTGDLWNPLLLWFVVPYTAFYVPLKILKHRRRSVLLVGTILFASALITLDLRIRFF